MGHVLLRERRRRTLSQARLRQALEDLDSFDTRTHLALYTAR